MITIHCEEYSIIAEGHAKADRNAEGHDLVCCAVSAIIQELGNYIDEIDYMLEASDVDYSESGYYSVEAMPLEEYQETVSNLFKMTIKALTDLSILYPKSICMG